MDFKRVYTSSKTYITLLVVALGILVFTAGMTYRQIINMQKSSASVNHTLQVFNGISNLTTHFSQAESEEFRNELLKTGGASQAFKEYKQEGQNIIDSLKVLTSDDSLQIDRLNSLSVLLERLYSQLELLEAIDYKNTQEAHSYRQSQKMKVSGTLYHIREVKNEMLASEQELMQKRKSTYDSYKSLAPLTLTILTFIAILVFVLSFIRIYKNKKRFRESEAFLKNVLGTTDNVVNFYEPIFGIQDEIIDFKIIYANDCNRDYFGIEPDIIVGQTISNVFPFLMENGEFEKMKTCFLNKTKEISDRQIVIQDNNMWFQSIVTPLANGILETARNSTAEEEAKEVQLTFKKKLEKQNLKLLDNRAFLGNIFKSISHIVMNFKSIRDVHGKIIDFKILFVNDRINPVTGDIPEDLKNKKVSQVFPDIFENGVFEHLVNAVELKKSEEYEVPLEKNGKTIWFHATAIKLGDGVTVTTRDVTEEKAKANQLLKLNDQLVIRNSILTDAESIAKIGSFLWYLDSDISEMSDNYFQMLGYQPNEFKSSFKTYKEFIHPDDLEMVEEKSAQALKSLKPSEYTYRVITKNGNVKHFKTNGQFINKSNQTVMIGVVQDVTQSIVAEEKLRKSNLELLQSNAELESFNRVASHDLQEPLRKIQLFITRIEDMESDRFSDKGKTYFEKVKNAGVRMQSLIQNLLAYSRIDSTKTDFEKLNLNHVLEKVTEDLATNINDYNAHIKIDKLPEIKGIFFQMEQLFANLISNALKYRNTIDTPIIEITYQNVLATEVPKPFVVTGKQYHKISVIDNGIGFDDVYAEKIFEVFQRLHQKTEYSGTGIGLAICKKIVENHSGYIHATGKLGLGSQFIIYLPA
ncbi:PAS domain-containing protein [Xanthomarina sp. F2636L]|uniref:PAS domain-containing protein n=1 Tax=Xanthomarina sp. F2636L TaxID=2996018 RepID=UPI00225E1D0B|nr:PAS domain-containing protein [Xanthomarina sp. F2636L]MCX7550081.1 PAS domain-containing protein [Xanthomarina sp. F2636L]